MAKVTPRKGGNGKLYNLGKLYIVIAVLVVAGLAWFLTRGGGPRPDTFVVDPTQPPAAVEGFRMGSPDAPVLIQEWADFECPACMQFATITEPDVRSRLIETGQAQFEFFFFPLEQHRSAASAAYAAACAADQDKFWEMHDAIFNGFGDWAQGRARDPKGVFERYAGQIGLDVAEWSSCYDSDRHEQLITAHKAAGMAKQVNSTPTFLVNGRMVPGAQTYDDLKAIVEEEAAKVQPPAADTVGAEE